jgi:hypothetical protein
MFIAALFLPVYVEVRTAGAFLNIQPPIDTLEKSSAALSETEDIKKGAEKANVLIMLDVGSPMTFTANGTMPEWDVNVSDQNTAAQMLKQATYGHGGLPMRSATTNTAPRTRYGRDVDPSNNMTSGNINLLDHLNNYYSPFDYANNPASVAFGRGTAERAPYALVFRNPQYWQNGKTGNISASDLVPNDSRMYKMKLVMWRILSETTLIENLRFGLATTFQEMNGASTTYGADYYKSGPLDNPATATWIPNSPAVNGAHYNAPGYGAHQGGIFQWGSGPGWSTNQGDGNFTTPGYGYYQAASAYMGIDRNYYDYGHNTMQWRLMNRAWLRVPIEEFDDDGVHIAKFRMWIDGLEDITAKTGAAAGRDAFYYANPELFGDGKTYLSTAIYPGASDLSRNKLVGGASPGAGGSNDLTGKGGVVFSSRDTYTIMSMNANFGLGNAQNGTLIGNFFRQNSGEALGTVLDFFSPPRKGYGGMSYDAYNLPKAPASNFPLTNPCEKNWVIIFTAGDDSGDYTSAKAVGDLYTYTKNNPLTRHTGINGSGNNTFDEIRLQDGIRTLVVGFVHPTDQASAALRTKLNAMAAAGDPGNPAAKAFFANDVQGLIDAMRSVLARINNEIQPEEGSMLEGDSITGDTVTGYDSANEEMFNLYGRSYRINIYDQWEGKVSKYAVAKDNLTGKLRTNDKPDWEVGDKLLSRRNAAPAGTASRNLVFWAGGGGGHYETLEYTPINSASRTSPHPDVSVSGYNLNLTPPITSMDATILGGSTSNHKDWTKRMHPSRALVNWYYGYEVNYGHFSGQDTQEKRRYMLSDTGNSGLAKGGPPAVQNSLPGYNAYANYPTNKALPHKLYFQTNDGLLHVVNAQSGAEDMAILPPPSLLSYRLFGLKTTKEELTQKYRWINVDGFLTTTSDDIPITSHPSFTLDGPVQRFYMNLDGRGETDGSGWKAMLIATLGHAGGGIYAMDVSSPANPEFRWYRETYEDEDGTLHLYRLDESATGPEPAETKVTMTDALWNKVYTSGDLYPFYQLGFNTPKPSFGPAKHEPAHAYPNGYYNVLALAGGMQNYLDLARNGTMGSALYLIDPDVDYHKLNMTPPLIARSEGLLVYNSGSVKKAGSDWRPSDSADGVNIPNPYMGMVVTEPVFFSTKDNSYVARGVFTADNRGNMFYVSFVDHGTGEPLDRDDWEIRTIATLRKSGDDPKDSYALPLGVALGSRVDRGEEWIAGGTSNVGTKGKTLTNDTMVRNKEQMIFCFKMPEMADSGTITDPNPNYGISKRGADWTSISADDANNAIEQNKRGWYIPLEKGDAAYEDEYVTTRPEMINGKLYVATFRELKFDTGGGACDTGQKNGLARFYALEADTGRAAVWRDGDKKYLDFQGLKITGFTHSEMGKKDTLLIHFERLNIADANNSINEATSEEDKLAKSDLANTLELIELGSGGAGTTNIISNDQVVNYWRYIE